MCAARSTLCVRIALPGLHFSAVPVFAFGVTGGTESGMPMPESFALHSLNGPLS